MKILWFGDLAGTGFGSVTMDLTRPLLEEHDVRFVSMNELGDLPEPFKSRTFVVNDPAGWLALSQKGGAVGLMDGSLWDDGWVPEAAVILGDYEAVRSVVMANEATRETFGRIPTYHYVPIEGIGLPPRWKAMWDIVHPIAMSEFGATEIEKVTGVRPPMVYHGVDTEQFRPVSMERPLYMHADGQPDRKLRTKADCKRFFGGDPDTLWMLRADRHMPRKLYASLFRSLAPVLHQREAVLVTHCRTDDQGGDLDDLRSLYPPPIAARILNTGFHDQMGGASRDILTALYNAADIYVSVSAEGFGLTIAEAIACGTPAIGMDYSAVPEVVGPAGMVVPVATLIDNEYAHFWARVNEVEFGKAALSLLDDEVTRKRLGRAGPTHVKANFQWAIAAASIGRIIASRAEVAA